MTEKEFDKIYFDDIGMCGCGSPDDVKVFIYRLLKNHKNMKDELITFQESREIYKKIIKSTDPDIIFEFVFHVLDHNGLLEHGGMVYSSWFTDEGNDFLQYLEEVVKQAPELTKQ